MRGEEALRAPRVVEHLRAAACAQVEVEGALALALTLLEGDGRCATRASPASTAATAAASSASALRMRRQGSRQARQLAVGARHCLDGAAQHDARGNHELARGRRVELAALEAAVELALDLAHERVAAQRSGAAVADGGVDGARVLGRLERRLRARRLRAALRRGRLRLP